MFLRVLIAAIVVAALGYGVFWFDSFKNQMIAGFFSKPKPPITISAVEVGTESWTPSLEAIGTVSARSGVDVPARAAGIIKEIYFKSNDDVEKGAVLVQLDDEIERADLIAAKANEARDVETLRRISTLNDKGVSSASNLENATAALDVSRSQVQRVEAALNQKRIVAPFSGTIGISQVNVGQFLGAGTIIATLQDLNVMKVDFTVPEQMISQVHIGQDIEIEIDGGANIQKGKITGIDPKIDPQSRLLSLQAEVDNTGRSLHPGQFATVRIILPTEDNVMLLPQTAVIESLYGTYVYRVVDKEGEQAADQPKQQVVQQVFVTVGQRFGGKVVVKSGIEAGDVVVNAGQNKLSVGSSVTIDNTIDPSSAKAGS